MKDKLLHLRAVAVRIAWWLFNRIKIITQFLDQYSIERRLNIRGARASELIGRLLLNERPVMICRFGNTELESLLKYRQVLKGNSPFDSSDYQSLDTNAGFFPVTEDMLARFYQRMIADMSEVDLLGSWIKGEEKFRHELINAKRCRLRDLEPYYHQEPWSATLEGKRVLVVHPFAETIRQQYLRRSHLFPDGRILPCFELLTLKAVQSIGHSDGRLKYDNWFEALKAMEDSISNLNFEIAIIGCGAYGFPLAAHVKRLGRKAVHLGGATQILFGIRGKRWDSNASLVGFYNDAWVRPSNDERPDGFMDVEDGTYW